MTYYRCATTDCDGWAMHRDGTCSECQAVRDAAPDLLFSLKAMVAAMIEFDEASLSATNRQARRALIAEAQAAIDKAEGNG